MTAIPHESLCPSRALPLHFRSRTGSIVWPKRPTDASSHNLFRYPQKKRTLSLGAAPLAFRVPRENGAETEKRKMFMNRATLIGYLAKDAETRTTRNGLNFTVLTLATKASWKDRDGAWQSHSEFHRCIVIWN